MSRRVQRVLVYGGGAAVVFAAGSLGAHPIAAVVFGVVGCLVIAAVLGAVAPLAPDPASVHPFTPLTFDGPHGPRATDWCTYHPARRLGEGRDAAGGDAR